VAQTTRPTDAPSRSAAGGSAFSFGPFRLNTAERTLHRHGVPVPLGGRAFDILTLLVRRAGQVVRHDELLAHAWAEVSVSPSTPRVHLTALRKALGCRSDRVRYIANVPGRGYCFVAPVVAATEPRPFGAHRQPADQSVDIAAEHVLAQSNTLRTLISGKLGVPRGLHPGLGPRNDRAAWMENELPAAAGPRTTPERENPNMTRRRLAVAAAITLLTCVAEARFAGARAATPLGETANVTHYRTATIDGLGLFYREAGPANGPVVLLLHGFPTSSHMFRNLIPTLSDRYHVIAPDYPGFGQSAAPDHTQFAYTFAHYASLVDALLQHLGVMRYAMYVMDYGAPVGYRLALLHPDRVTALIVQNGNAYAEGLGAFWDPIKAYWADGSEAHRRALDVLVAPETTKFQYTDGVRDVSRISPDNWVHDQALLDRPGNRDIQLDLFHDYGSNVPLYPQFQAFFRKYQPPTLIVWGENDKIFPAAGATPYLRDLPKAEMHLLDTGHFALEDKLDVMAPLIRDFLDRSVTN
jgi:pimeloyl-ACP methyl ester carboxylesterase/DNA-binding winged helix-turn-helix (wHTH) protein